MNTTKKKSPLKRLLYVILFGIIIILVIVFAINREQPPEMTTQNEATEVSDSTLVEDDVEIHFKKAQQLFAKGDIRAAAAEIRKSASALTPKIELVPEETAALQKTIKDLEALADSVEQGTLKQLDQLKNAFSTTELRLAEFYRKIAIQAWAEKNYQRAGEALKYSTQYLKRAAEWSGEKIGSGFRVTIDNARVLGQKLLKGAGLISGEVKDGLDNIGNEIEKLNKRLTDKKEK